MLHRHGEVANCVPWRAWASLGWLSRTREKSLSVVEVSWWETVDCVAARDNGDECGMEKRNSSGGCASAPRKQTRSYHYVITALIQNKTFFGPFLFPHQYRLSEFIRIHPSEQRSPQYMTVERTKNYKLLNGILTKTIV